MKLKPVRPRFRIRFEVVRVRIETVFVAAKVFLKSQNFWRFRGNGLAFAAAVLFVLDVMALVPDNEILFFMIIKEKTSMDIDNQTILLKVLKYFL
jgi:hypothetical protein